MADTGYQRTVKAFTNAGFTPVDIHPDNPEGKCTTCWRHGNRQVSYEPGQFGRIRHSLYFGIDNISHEKVYLKGLAKAIEWMKAGSQ